VAGTIGGGRGADLVVLGEVEDTGETVLTLGD